jgi:hypothetical protein
MKKVLIILVLVVFNILQAQEKSDFKIDFSGYLEAYYAVDVHLPTTETKLPFMYNYNRHNEFNINIGLLRGKVEYENAYANIALQAGTYVDDNYANEKIKYLNEAFVGLYLDKAKKNSIEVGILPSYIGFESATTASNLTLTRSILAENSPYYMTGIKYNYKPNAKWSFSGLVTNGWQRISKPEKDIVPSLGTQIQSKASEKSILNWSTFVGKEYYLDDLTMRYFSNLYWDYKWNSKWRTITGFDIGVQDISSKNDEHAIWLSPVFIAQCSLTSKWQTAVRVEYYQDKENIIIANESGFETFGFSLNADYLFNSKVKWRTEARYLESKKPIFMHDDDLVKSNFFMTTSLSFEF